MGGTSPRAGSYAIYLPCHSVQRGERLYCVARWLGCRPSAALIGAPPCSVPQRASAAPLGLAGSWSRVRRWRVCVAGARGVSILPPAPQTLPRHACSAPPSRGLFAPYGRWRRLAGVRLTGRRSLIIGKKHRQPTPAIDKSTRIII